MSTSVFRRLLIFGLIAALVAPTTVAQAAPDTGAMVSTADCTQNVLTTNDDSSTAAIQLPFGIDFYGVSYEKLWVNNNGNVTFDGPLSTFTPFGLSGTTSQIIAPFFADVDTRGVGAQPVTYGWGNTTYEGHRAFCVSWENVGYYAGHADKLNSFQLLLVHREDSTGPGDFDIVFNYNKVEWETGDASGGAGGMGGTSASAGFSNGTLREGTYYELPGSLVNRAFLDSNPIGLAATSTDSTVLGRHVFRVRGGSAPPTQYVALGDSFQSGEGAGDYLPLTDTAENKCHRSANAYPRKLVDNGSVDLNLDFGACSGALIDDLKVSGSADRPPYTDGMSQLDRLDSSTKLVTLGIGGNDLGFSHVLRSCIGDSIVDFFNVFSETSCEASYGEELRQSYDVLASEDRLEDIYKEVRRRAPFARIVLIGYPRFYVEGGARNQYNDNYCAGIRIADQRWINSEIRKLNTLISNEAGSLGLQYVDDYDVSDGHELCGTDSEFFMNGATIPVVESYHPTSFGHALIADRVAAALSEPDPGVYYNVLPGEIVTTTFQSDGGPVSVSTQWPGSDVVLSLTAPSGRVINRSVSADDVDHEVGPTAESYELSDTEPGEWTVTLFGAQVAPLGEPTRLSVWHQPVPNKAPTASFSISQDQRTITVDAGASTDPDGEILEYLWEFGDGATATGPTATHTCEAAGTYLTTLAIKDRQGGEAFAEADHKVDIPKYTFSGFFSPVTAAPGMTGVRAGSAVPMKFSIGGDFGLGVLPAAPTSTQSDCTTSVASTISDPAQTPGASRLTYDSASQTYSYVWKTEKNWSGTCRIFTMTLDDGSSHQAVFNFRK